MVEGLAVWRLTHLLTEDSFPPIADTREAIIARCGEDHWLSYLVTCVYCTGAWVGVAAVLARRFAPRVWRQASMAAALAAAAPLVEAALMRLEGR